MDRSWHNRRVSGLDCIEDGQNLPLDFLQECCDCVNCMRLCIVLEWNDSMGVLAWSFRFDHLVKGGHGLQVMLGIHYCAILQEVLSEGCHLGQRLWVTHWMHTLRQFSLSIMMVDQFRCLSDLSSYGFHCNLATMANKVMQGGVPNRASLTKWCPSYTEMLVPLLDPCKGHVVDQTLVNKLMWSSSKYFWFSERE